MNRAEERNRRRGSLRHKILTGLVALSCFVALGASAAVAYYSLQLDAALQRFKRGVGKRIYSAPLQLKDIDSREELISELRARDYSKAQSSEKILAGEYFVDEVRRTFTVSRRPVSGLPIFSKGHQFELPIEVQKWDTLENVYLLEPLQLSASSSGNLREFRDKSLSEFPLLLQQAFLAAEDHRFYSHFGVDLPAVIRASVVNIAERRVVQGASTITQQIAKNILLTPDRSLSRKIREVFAAIALELRFSKEDLLELYMNSVYLGQLGSHSLHGVEIAANMFFDKRAEELELGEIALLAGLPKAPSSYAPTRFPTKATTRRNQVLSRMRELGFITDSQMHLAKQSVLTLKIQSVTSNIAPHFTDSLSLLEDQNAWDISVDPSSELHLITSIRPSLQKCALEAVSGAKSLPRESEVGLVSLDIEKGMIQAWVGARNYESNQYDHVLLAKRQVGSTLKPFVYLSAMDLSRNPEGPLTARSTLMDVPLELHAPGSKPWKPENYDRKFLGAVTLRYALERSRNIPAIRTLQHVGVSRVVDVLEDFGLSPIENHVPSLALGALDLNLLELTVAYGTLANGGVFNPPRALSLILDQKGDEQYQAQPRGRRVASEAASFILSDILRGVVERGTGKAIRRAGVRAQAAGKTGTSNEKRDAWFVGFTPKLVTGIWVGRDDNKPIGVTGGGAAAPIWASFMSCVESFEEQGKFSPPDTVRLLSISAESGKQQNKQCPGRTTNVVTEFFINSTEPELEPCYLTPKRSTPNRPRRNRGFWERLFG